MAIDTAKDSVTALLLPPAQTSELSDDQLAIADTALGQLVTPFETHQSIFCLNFATDKVARDGGSSTLGAIEISDEVLSLASLLGTKGIIPSNGHCIVGEAHRELVAGFTQYTDRVGLTDGAFSNIHFVEDVHDIKRAVAVIAALGKQVEFYYANSDAVTIAKEAGALPTEIDTGTTAVDYFGNKSNLRDDADAICRDLTGQSLFDFPRIKIPKGITLGHPDDPALAQQLSRALNYYPESSGLHPEENLKLFVQVVDAAGGKEILGLKEPRKDSLPTKIFGRKAYYQRRLKTFRITYLNLQQQRFRSGSYSLSEGTYPILLFSNFN